MKAKIVCYKLKMPIIPARISLVIGSEMLKLFMERFHMQTDQFLLDMVHNPQALGGFLNLGGQDYVIILPDEWVHSTVYHEALHAATRMWYDIGAELKVPENDEVLTYTVGYIADFIEAIYLDKNKSKEA